VQLLSSALELRQAGFESLVACPAAGALGKKAAESGFEVLNLKPSGDADIVSAWKLARFADSRRVDILHAHHPKAHACALLAKLFSRTKPALVVTRRVIFPLKTTFFGRLKYDNSLVNGFICVSDAVKKILTDYGIPEQKTTTIYSGVDTGIFKPTPRSTALAGELSLPEGTTVVGIVGNYSANKGHWVLVKAAAALSAEGRRIIFVFAGNGTDSGELAGLIEKERLDPKFVRITGFEANVPRLMSVFDISVSSALKEGLAGSIRESMAMGVPVIAGATGGNTEIITDGKTGLLFTPGNWGELAEKIKLLIDSPSKAHEYAKNAKELVERKFSLKTTARQLTGYYLTLLKKPPFT
jgi:glycosyltransferase involved in cell wall biosynthesis